MVDKKKLRKMASKIPVKWDQAQYMKRKHEAHTKRLRSN